MGVLLLSKLTSMMALVGQRLDPNMNTMARVSSARLQVEPRELRMEQGLNSAEYVKNGA